MSNTETSIALSLADLTRIEESRLEEERARTAREEAARKRAAREAELARRAEEDARARAEEAQKSERAAAEAIARVKAEARERAAAEVQRIEAESRARLAADNARRAHELAELEARRKTGRRRRELVLGAALATALALLGLTGSHARALAQRETESAAELKEHERTASRDREEARRLELRTLERRYERLLTRAGADQAKSEKATASAAMGAVDPKAPVSERLRALEEAVDAFEARIERAEKLAELDRREADLGAWATSLRDTKRRAELSNARAAAHRSEVGARELEQYAAALDGASLALRSKSGGGRGGSEGAVEGHTRVCAEGDPGCGLDGKPVF